MGPIFKYVMSVLAKKSGKAGITTIPRASSLNVEISVKQIEQTLKNMGVDISKIKSTKEVEKFLNIHDSWIKQQTKAKAKASDKDFKSIENYLEGRDTLFGPKKDLPEWTEGWKPTVIEGGKGAADYGKLKEEWFSRLIANTDEDINTFVQGFINQTDDRFKNFSQGQRKDFLNMVQDRIQLGNEKFMDTYTDTKGVFNKFLKEETGINWDEVD